MYIGIIRDYVCAYVYSVYLHLGIVKLTHIFLWMRWKHMRMYLCMLCSCYVFAIRIFMYVVYFYLYATYEPTQTAQLRALFNQTLLKQTIHVFADAETPPVQLAGMPSFPSHQSFTIALEAADLSVHLPFVKQLVEFASQTQAILAGIGSDVHHTSTEKDQADLATHAHVDASAPRSLLAGETNASTVGDPKAEPDSQHHTLERRRSKLKPVTREAVKPVYNPLLFEISVRDLTVRVAASRLGEFLTSAPGNYISFCLFSFCLEGTRCIRCDLKVFLWFLVLQVLTKQKLLRLDLYASIA
jgi:hypothetical protein